MESKDFTGDTVLRLGVICCACGALADRGVGVDIMAGVLGCGAGDFKGVLTVGGAEDGAEGAKG